MRLGGEVDDMNPLGVEAQLAVLHTKVDTLIQLNQTRGEDHEARLRRLEDARGDYITRRGAITLVTVACVAVTTLSNVAQFLLR